MTALQQIQRSWNIRLTWHKRRSLEGYIFSSPWVIGLLAFFLYPMLYNIYISFTKWKLVGGSEWVGLGNYQIMSKDPLIAQSLKVTGVYTLIAVPLGLVAGLTLAYLLNQKIKGLAVFRTIYYMPAILAGPAIAVLWQWMFNTNYGLVNYLLRVVGVPSIPWLTSREWVIPFFVIMSLWTVGSSMILYLAGLQGIPTDYYEAAEVDGANGLQKLWYVTLPMMSPVIFFTLVTGIIASFQTFTTAYVVTDGGPANASLFYYLYLYKMGFRHAQLGYAAAMAWLLFIILAMVTFVIFKTSGIWVYYEGE